MNKRIKLLIFAAAAVLHIMLLVFVRFGAVPALAAASPAAQAADAPGIMRLVNIQQAPPIQIPAVQAHIPPVIQPPSPTLLPLDPPPTATPAPPTAQPSVPAESPPAPQSVPLLEAATGQTLAAQNNGGLGQTEYLLQHQISALPVLPVNEIIRNVVYPHLARQLNIEGIVHLELFIDRLGNITNIRVLAETPANRGFGTAATNAFRGIRALRPAELNGVPVAVRFQYSLNFTLR